MKRSLQGGSFRKGGRFGFLLSLCVGWVVERPRAFSAVIFGMNLTFTGGLTGNGPTGLNSNGGLGAYLGGISVAVVKPRVDPLLMSCVLRTLAQSWSAPVCNNRSSTFSDPLDGRTGRGPWRCSDQWHALVAAGRCRPGAVSGGQGAVGVLRALSGLSAADTSRSSCPCSASK